MGENGKTIITYDEFCNLIKNEYEGEDGFDMLIVKKLVDKPQRFIGKFRLSNSKTKLLQNILYSREIVFGKILEQLFQMCFERVGYYNFNNDLGRYGAHNNRRLEADLLFEDDSRVYLIEMKVRDDHDNSKADGQLTNFDLKTQRTIQKYPNKQVVVYMWFVDDSFRQHQTFYEGHINEMSTQYPQATIRLVYGSNLTENFNRGSEIWNEFTFWLERYQDEHENDVLEIPDLVYGEGILDALVKLPEHLWTKLNSEVNEYEKLRQEYFHEDLPNSNINKARNKRKELNDKKKKSAETRED